MENLKQASGEILAQVYSPKNLVEFFAVYSFSLQFIFCSEQPC